VTCDLCRGLEEGMRLLRDQHARELAERDADVQRATDRAHTLADAAHEATLRAIRAESEARRLRQKLDAAYSSVFPARMQEW
jgi:hypothetical protein